MKFIILILLLISLCACGKNTTPSVPSDINKEGSSVQTEISSNTEYVIGEKFGTNTIECVIKDFKCYTLEDVLSHPKTKEFTKNNITFKRLSVSDIYPDYEFIGASGFSSLATDYPYFCVTFELKNIGKEMIPTNTNSENLQPFEYGDISLIFDDKYTFDNSAKLTKPLQIFGDSVKLGRTWVNLPADICTDDSKTPKLRITLTNSLGEKESFIVSVR